MTHQTKLTDMLNPNKFVNCKLKPRAVPTKKFFTYTFLNRVKDGTPSSNERKLKVLKKPRVKDRPEDNFPASAK